MVLTYHVPPLAKEQGLCDFDNLESRKIQKNIRKLGSPGTAKLDR